MAGQQQPDDSLPEAPLDEAAAERLVHDGGGQHPPPLTSLGESGWQPRTGLTLLTGLNQPLPVLVGAAGSSAGNSGTLSVQLPSRLLGTGESDCKNNNTCLSFMKT